MLDFNRRGELESFGYSFIGPVVSAYFQSVLEQLGDDIETKKCFFLAREGYFLEEIFVKYCEENKPDLKLDTSYLMCSRSFLFKLSLSEDGLIDESLKHHYKGTFKRFLMKRYGLCGSDLNKILTSNPSFKSQLDEEVRLPSQASLIKKHLEKVRVALQEELEYKKALYKKYLAEVDFLESDALIFDLGFSGTIQKILGALTGKQLDGHYVVTTKNAKDTEALKFYGHLAQGTSFGDGFMLLDRSLYLESVLTAPHGQVVDITEVAGKIRFLFAPKTSAQKDFEVLEKIISGAIAYIKDTSQTELKLSKDDVVRHYNAYVSASGNIPSKVRGALEVDDHISGFGILNPTQLFG